MLGQHPRVHTLPHPPEQSRRALDVGEQERERLHEHSVERRPGTAAAPSAGPQARGFRPRGVGRVYRRIASGIVRSGRDDQVFIDIRTTPPRRTGTSAAAGPSHTRRSKSGRASMSRATGRRSSRPMRSSSKQRAYGEPGTARSSGSDIGDAGGGRALAQQMTPLADSRSRPSQPHRLRRCGVGMNGPSDAQK